MVGRVGTGVDDGGDFHALGGKVARCPMAVIIVGKDCHVRCGGNRPSVRVGANGTGLHNSRPVIIRKGDRSFD